MKGKVKFAFAAVLLVFTVCAVAVPSASAARVILQNTLDNRVNIAITYFDRATGLWTTRGWWRVDGNSDRTINIDNVDTGRNVLYVGMSGNTMYLDRSTLDSDPINRWISDDSFRFDSTSNSKPSGKNVRTVPFYRSRYSRSDGAYIIRIDTRPVG